MRTQFQVMLIAAALAVPAGAPVSAQVVTPPQPPGEGTWVEPPKALPPVARGDRLRNLDFLFGALKVAPDDTSAKAIEGRIWAVWASSRSDTATLLMTRVRTAIEAKDTDLALQLLDGVVKIRPDYVEAWNRRATLHYMNRDFSRALADIREILRREPRHFGALAGLGMILQEIGDDKQALEVYRRALAVHPRLERIGETVKTLQEKVEGRDI